MASYLLDTNHLSPLITPDHPLRQRFVQQHAAGDSFSIAIPALTEMLFGIRTLPRAERNLQEWQIIEGLFTFYHIEKRDGEAAADLQVTLRRQGWQLGTVDALIATIALRYGLILLTKDKDYRAVPRLQQNNWLTPQHT
ncbi:MAG: type II toxin-antitoxin system VapC family toxin [Caldilineaceae bacterium]